MLRNKPSKRYCLFNLNTKVITQNNGIHKVEEKCSAKPTEVEPASKRKEKIYDVNISRLKHEFQVAGCC